MGARWIATVSYLALVVLQPVWYLWWHPPRVIGPAWATGIAVAPLLILVPGVLRDRPRAWIWACFLGIVYFVHGATEAWAIPPARPAALTETGLTLALFASVTLRLRHPPRSR